MSKERMGLTEYLDAVTDYWGLSQDLCERCEMNIEHGYCAMLHDSSVPDGDCLGLAAIGIHQPADAILNQGSNHD